MHFVYRCDRCGAVFSDFAAPLDMRKFGFDCLTAADWKDIISFDEAQDTMYVTSLCDSCAAVYAPKAQDSGLLN